MNKKPMTKEEFDQLPEVRGLLESLRAVIGEERFQRTRKKGTHPADLDAWCNTCDKLGHEITPEEKMRMLIELLAYFGVEAMALNPATGEVQQL